MANWAIIKDNIVINIIVAETKEIAEETTQSTAIEYTNEKPLSINWYLENGIWYAPKPDDGLEYIWSIEQNRWILPEEVTE